MLFFTKDVDAKNTFFLKKNKNLHFYENQKNYRTNLEDNLEVS